MKQRKERGITLIALVVTIIIMLILAGVVISELTGENGLIKKAEQVKERTEYQMAKEEIDLKLQEVVVKCEEEGIEYSIEEIAKAIEEDDEKVLEKYFGTSTSSIGEYASSQNLIIEDIVISVKKYSKYKFLVGETEEGTQDIKGVTTEEITEIADIEDFKSVAEFENSILKIASSPAKVDYLKNNESLIGAISKVNQSGYSTIQVTGKTEATAQEETVNYNIHTIVYNGNMVFNGVNTFDDIGITYDSTESTYLVGDKTRDVATATTDAQYMVVLKVNGNLTVNENIKLTACKSDDGFGGPKGMFIYCTGALKNDGEISMTARGARATGQNIYLWENNDNSFEFVPAVGADGGSTVTVTKSSYEKKSTDGTAFYRSGQNGGDGTGRSTGGGASGGARTNSRKSNFWKWRKRNIIFRRSRRRSYSNL